MATNLTYCWRKLRSDLLLHQVQHPLHHHQLPGDGMEDILLQAVNPSQQIARNIWVSSHFPARITQQFIRDISKLPNTGSSGLEISSYSNSPLPSQHLPRGPHQVVALLQLFLLLPAGAWDCHRGHLVDT